jgi:hypothetical protein
MSLSGISNNSPYNYAMQSLQNQANLQQFQQQFQQLGQELQSGNLSSAQQDYSNIEQDFQSQDTQHGRCCRGGSGEEDQNQISQTFQQLGQELQFGDLSGSQQAYGSLQQELQALTPNGAAAPAQGTAISGVSIMA